MATLGFADLKNTALPSLWDSTEIIKAQMADGATFEQMVADIEAGLAELNAMLLDMPHYGGLLAVGDDVAMKYEIGVSNGVQEITEYGKPDPKRGATTGHTLPLKSYARGLGWTQMYLRKANMIDLDADVRSVVRDIKDHWQQTALTRFFKKEGETVGSTSNASVPLADGGDTDSSYVPPDSPEGESFASSHDHFLRHAALNDTNLNTTLEHLQEHGHQAPFDAIGARADAATWTALTGWKAPEWPGVMYHASGVERADVMEITNYFGYVETDYGIVRVWLTPRVPTAYYGVFRSYGPGDPRNPVRVRIDANTGYGWRLVPGVWVNAPEQMAVPFAEYGMGIAQDRTNGVCVEIDSAGDYATPTIS
jgi:hypothetical protein